MLQSGGDVSKSQIVTQDLPFLRRYARALSGSQTSGDAYVTATLEAVIADRSLEANAVEEAMRATMFGLLLLGASPIALAVPAGH